jgi:hypothetical protein
MHRASELHQAIAQTRLITDGCPYIFLRFPLAQSARVTRWLQTANSSFVGLLWDDLELSLMVEQKLWKSAPRTLVKVAASSPAYRRVTFDVLLDFDMVGYLDLITRVLAANSIAVLAFSAFSRDHIFVQQVDFDRAWGILQATVRSFRETDCTHSMHKMGANGE